jgi:hypothetical protein
MRSQRLSAARGEHALHEFLGDQKATEAAAAELATALAVDLAWLERVESRSVVQCFQLGGAPTHKLYRFKAKNIPRFAKRRLARRAGQPGKWPGNWYRNVRLDRSGEKKEAVQEEKKGTEVDEEEQNRRNIAMSAFNKGRSKADRIIAGSPVASPITPSSSP